jgi:predicted dehydrogenase
MACFLQMVSARQVQLDVLISHRFKIEYAAEAYAVLTEPGPSPCIGVLLEYPKSAEVGPSRVRLLPESPRPARDKLRLGVIGAGLFARTTLLPELRRLGGIEFRNVAAASGLSAYDAARKFGFTYATTDAQEIIADPEVDCVIVLTRHNLHARFVVDALAGGKDVFVEKPLALTLEELEEVVEAWQRSPGRLMVGFNRRHSSHALAVRRWLAGRGGSAVIACRVNAGDVPATSWVNDPVEGGGRILGELCHFVDLVQFLAGSPVLRLQVAVPGARSAGQAVEDLAATLELADGSVGSIVYTARGHRSLPRERVEIFSHGSACVIDNFRATRFFGSGRPGHIRTWRQDRGHLGELTSWIAALRHGDPSPVPFREYVAATLATFALAEGIKAARPVEVDLSLIERCQKEGSRIRSSGTP